ncbi:MAG: type III pantothenate kinase [Anaerovoracaceae bacterium]|jgi:type III pantothenate kinase
MLLAFDIGNSNTVLGLYQGEELKVSWRIETDSKKSADEYGVLIGSLFSMENYKFSDVDAVIISTVVPSVLYTVQHMAQKYFHVRPIVVESGVKTGLIVKYDNPKQVGADRIVNAVAAYNKYGGPLIIIDFGTATTFCAVSDKAEYFGGTIAPGLKIASEALFSQTSKLPKVELEEPGRTICRNTIQSMQSGLIYGHMGMVEFLVRAMRKELKELTGTDKKITVVATGGLATMIASGVDCIDIVDRMLTLDGLRIIYDKNRGLKKKQHYKIAQDDYE